MRFQNNLRMLLFISSYFNIFFVVILTFYLIIMTSLKDFYFWASTAF